MALSLHDHQLRIEDLEVAVEALTRALLSPQQDKREAFVEEIQKLRSDGAKGAVALMEGDKDTMGYRG